MKKTFFNILAISLLSLFIFACSDVWTGDGLSAEKTSFGNGEGAATISVGTSSSGHEIARYALFELGGTEFYTGADENALSTIAKASSESSVTLNVKSYSRLDSDSISKAFEFYSLADNSIYANAAPNRRSKLTVAVGDVTESVSSGTATSRNVTTSIDFTVDTSNVTTSAIALVCLAGELKDVHGNAVLNANQNEVCGEETDCLVRYIAVTLQKDDSATTALSFSTGEDFSPKLPYSACFDIAVVSNSDGTFTPASGSAEYYDYDSSKTVYKIDLANTLSSLFVLQTLKPGETEYTISDKLNFSYDDSTKIYKAQKVTIEPGTKFRIVSSVPAMDKNLSETVQSKTLYGHESYLSYTTTTYTSYGIESTASYYISEPEYIVSTAAFAKGEYTYDNITAAQNSILTVTQKGSGKFDVALGVMGGEQLEFVSGTTDFALLDDKLNLIPSTSYLKNSTTAVVALLNPFYTGTVHVWVGSGTEIKKNPVTDSSARKFGIYKDSSYAGASGYVKLD